MSEQNNGFLKRADAQIMLANEQMKEGLKAGDVSASFMYGSARFSAWMAAASFETKEDMRREKKNAVEYFMKEYKLALEEHFENHIDNYDFTQNNLD